ncbi:MAG: tRNA epoxyqueuosine(34) reductase QueG [Planctomycetes bacterium]|nr:tRNA epoxyqueuosine(34) reductase QueG [Planctomycetota bacterium]
MTTPSITAQLKEEARRRGFDLAGVCPAVTPPDLDRFDQWLAAGYAGTMGYLPDRANAYRHPRHVLGGVRSILMLAVNYRTEEPRTLEAGRGAISRYAWGDDYHDLIRDRLHDLADFHRELLPGVPVRGVVDTAPLLERTFARLAGLGWIGKNTMLLNRQLGSWFFLAALLSGAALEPDEPHLADHCGSCRACLDACPTGALLGDGRLDARRCVSYLTIELRDSIPADLGPGVGDRLFGCDACQDVCPWNRRTPVTEEPSFQPGEEGTDTELAALFDLDDAAFRQRFRKSPLWRARRGGLLRNAAIVLANRPCPSGQLALAKGLEDPDPLVRGTCARALGEFRA